MSWPRRLVVLLGLLMVGIVGLGGVASAHPLGNFTVNRYDGVVITADEVRIRHVVDFAEIPTVQWTPRIDVNGDSVLSSDELQVFADQQCEQAGQGLTVMVDGNGPALDVQKASASTTLGQAGLQTLRLECTITADIVLGTSPVELSIADANDVADVGWREMTLVGDGVSLLDSTVPAASVSDALRGYPEELLASPLAVSEAKSTVALGGPKLTDTTGSVTTTPEAKPPGGFGSGLLNSATQSATGPVGMLLALVIAVVVGAAHALAPGHGKSLVAFALTGRRQDGARAAGVVGVTVTATHTLSVLLLGLLVATTSQFVPSAAFEWLGAASGLMIVGLGLVLLRNSLRRRDGHHHSHDHGHDHDHGHHGGQPHHQPHVGSTESNIDGSVTTLTRSTVGHDHVQSNEPRASRGVLVTLGVAGGLLPSPSAVVVLLATVAAGHAWFGVALVLAFGVGMAATLAAVAFLVLRAQERVLVALDRGAHPRVSGILARLPLITASAVLLGGVVLVTRSWPT